MSTTERCTPASLCLVLRPPDFKPAPCVRVDHVEEELRRFGSSLDHVWREVPLPPPVRRALCCIHVHLFNEALNVAYVRAQCQLHNHNISTHFKRAIGVGMRRYIERQRMQAAARLLTVTQAPVSEIAWALGYAYVESFDRAFRRCRGCSPSAFRARRAPEAVQMR